MNDLFDTPCLNTIRTTKVFILSTLVFLAIWSFKIDVRLKLTASSIPDGSPKGGADDGKSDVSNLKKIRMKGNGAMTPTNHQYAAKIEQEEKNRARI